jgi:hypothetical protein
MQQDNSEIKSRYGQDKLLAETVVLTRLESGRLGAQVFPLSLSLRDRLLRDGIHVSVNVTV